MILSPNSRNNHREKKNHQYIDNNKDLNKLDKHLKKKWNLNLQDYNYNKPYRKDNLDRQSDSYENIFEEELWQSAKIKDNRKIFQYEDFDFDVDQATNDNSNNDNENNDNDSANYILNNNNNQSEESEEFLEKSTPNNLISKHRRIYSKWSRWTKCSSKCTTRRYK